MCGWLAINSSYCAEIMAHAATQGDGVGYVRLSAHVYNTAADYEFFAERCVPALAGWARG